MLAAPKYTSKRFRSVLMALPVAFALALAGLILYRQSLATPLLRAVARQDPDAVAHLLRLGAPPNASENERTALYNALALDEGGMDSVYSPQFLRSFPAQRERIIALLLKAGADPNKAVFAMPMLYLALDDPSLPSAQALLTHGADPNASYSEMPLLMKAVQVDANLHDMGKEADPLFTQALLAAGADARLRHPYVKALVSSQQNILASSTFFLQELPLIMAVRCANVSYANLSFHGGDAALVETLLAHGADVNGRDHAGQTALFVAASQGDPNDVRVLLAHGAAPGLADRQEQTPLQAAQEAESKTLASARKYNKSAAKMPTRPLANLSDADRQDLADNQKANDEAGIKARYDAVIRMLIAANFAKQQKGLFPNHRE